MTSTMPIPHLLARLTADPGRPRLTWYAPDERVELSGHVLDNWVTKTANLLVEEYDAGPGTQVVIDLPVHWRAIVWALAVWRVGACVATRPAEPGPDLVVTDRPTEHNGVQVVAVALPALARSFDGVLPPGAVDATEAVLTYGDVLTWMPEPDPVAPALRADDAVVTHRVLDHWAARVVAEHGGIHARGRVLVETTGRAGLTDALGVVLGAYAMDGSVVLRAPADRAGEEPDALRHLLDSELVTDHIVLGTGSDPVTT